ncbi:putative bifunctional diguanylate cyclase/phosphodiesterase [Kineococcus sp. SYSU DK002]|uniref:putative bifunctional diguanylate cyclase/phosphodiesterase n=1 Tax=Kineococcus sp. SYSU DK002 TaxID=3383123 RepID=UPI003D7DAC8F
MTGAPAPSPVTAAAVVPALLVALALSRSLRRQREALRTVRAELARAERGVREARARERAALDLRGRAAPRTDPVTGLLSGAGFSAVVQEALRGPGRAGAPVAALHLDLVGFRALNRAHGRAAGDAVLGEVARRLRAAVRGTDEAARLGGDEFAVLLTDADAAVDVAVRLLAVLSEPYEVGASRLRVGVAVGVAHGRVAGAGLLRAAESAVAAAKAAGGGCVRVWDEAADRRREEVVGTVERLRRAVHAPTGDNRLEVHHQPTVDVDAGVVSGVECLVRWVRDGVLVPPDEFVPLAEEHGLVTDLGLVVLERAVAEAPVLHEAAGRALVVAVNVSAPQLHDPRFLPAVQRAVRALGEDRLVLEVTESVLVAEDEGTTAALDAVVAAGAHLTVDDFGTGCATLAYLRRRPFTSFKVDRSYVRDLETDPRTRALVEGLVLLAATMGMGLVAEGVETPGQAELLRRMGAPTHQGFRYARPAPVGEAARVVADLQHRLGAGFRGGASDR